MARIAGRLAPLGLIMALVSTVGCPFATPRLLVSPQAVSFGSDGTEAFFQIENTASGILSWQIQEDLHWLQVTPRGGDGSSQGTTGTEVDTIDLRVIRAGLAAGQYSGEILVTSNGGSLIVRVSMEVTAPATLSVSPSVLDLGETDTQATFMITNSGSEALQWSLRASATAGWLTAQPVSGTLGNGSETVQVTVNRSGLAAGPYEAGIDVSGNGLSATVTVRMRVRARLLVVEPRDLDFGTSGVQQTFAVSNGGPEALTWAVGVAADSFPAWANVAPTAGVATTGATTVTVTIDRSAVDFDSNGEREAQFSVTSEGGGGTATVTLAVHRAAFSVAPPELDFGAETETLNVTINNHGASGFTYTGAAGTAWLTLPTPSAAVPAGGSVEVAIQVDRTGLTTGSYKGAVTLSGAGHTEVVPVSMTVPAPPTLAVSDNQLVFAAKDWDKVLALWNAGTGTVNWVLDTRGLPEWLSVALSGQAAAPDILQGTLSGTATDSLRVSVNRRGMDPTTASANLVFTATDSAGNALAGQTVRVQMTVAPDPVLGVDTGSGPGEVDLGTSLSEAAISLFNLGTGTLTWSIDVTALPPWLAIGPLPLEGAIETNEEVHVLTVTVNRVGLPSGDYEHTVNVVSNGGTVAVTGKMTVPRPVLTATPAVVDMGATETNVPVSFSNTGGGVLVWEGKVAKEYPWLSLSPTAGEINTAAPQTVTITVDRSGIAHGSYEGFIDLAWNDSNLTRLRVMMTVPGPVLSVTPLSLAFGPANTEQILTVRNSGDTNRVLTWSVTELPLPWATVDPTVGTTLAEMDPVRVTIARSGLVKGSYQGSIVFTSNNGNQTIPVAMEVGALSVKPASLVIESHQDAVTFVIENHVRGTLAWAATKTAPWLDLSPAAGEISMGGRATVMASVSRDGLATQWYEDAITLAAPAEGYVQAVNVRMRVAGFELTPDQVDLGEIDVATDGAFEVRNIADAAIQWTASVSADAPWLTTDAVPDTETPFGATTTVTVTGDPTDLAPGHYAGTVTIAQGDDTDTVEVSMTVPAPPALTVSPTTLNFGATATDKLVAIWNSGVGEVNWIINSAALPAWLSVSRSVGTVPTDDEATHAVLVSIDRRGLPAPSSHAAGIVVNATDQDGNALAPKTVNVSMAVAAAPVLSIETTPAQWDANGKPLLALGLTADEGEFLIQNTGTGALNWQIDASSFPAWLSMPETLQGSLTADDEGARIHAVVDRAGLASGDHSFEVVVQSNAGNGTLRVVMTVPQPVLSFNPQTLSFGEDGTLLPFTLTNVGGDVLEWAISIPSDAPWITATPDNGSAIAGIENSVEVRVDRAGLSSGTYAAQVTIGSNGGDKQLLVTMTVPGPVLMVNPPSLSFGVENTTSTLTVRNSGDTSKTLTWTIKSGYPGWLTFSQDHNSVRSGTNVIEVRVIRNGLTMGTHRADVVFDSNGGTVTVPVTLEVPSITVSANELILSSQETTKSFSIENHTAASANWTATFDWPNWTMPSVTDWITATPAAHAIAPGIRQTVVVTVVDRSGLDAGWQAGPLVVRDTGSGYEKALSVQVRVPTFVLALPDVIDFGEISVPDSTTFTVQNTTGGAITWSATVSPESAWLSLGEYGGTFVGTHDVSVHVDPSDLTPGSYEGTVTVQSGEDTDTLTVRITVPVPPTLAAAPLNADFGTISTQKLLAIWNAGIGTIDWAINMGGFPAWLSLDGAASGSVAGAETDTLTLRVNRTGLAPNTYTHQFALTGAAAGAPVVPLTVRVTMTVVGAPIIEVNTGQVDEFGVPYINLATTLTEGNFRVRNVGTGTLFWQIDLTGAPGWLVSISPSQGSVEPGSQQRVDVVIDRTNFDFGGYVYTFTVTSNDLSNRAVDVHLQMQVPKEVIIGTSLVKIDIDKDSNSDVFEVANLGDSGSTLDFIVQTNKEWLYFFPATGRSVGTSLDIKDWQEVSISVDRSKLRSSGETARVEVHAFALDANQNRVLLDDTVKPVVISVSVVAAPLSFETAFPATRAPSLLRFPLLMRNIRYQAIPLPEAQLDLYGQSFGVFEKDVPLELSETNQFLTSGSRLRTDIAILLDYSGSMFEAAQLIEEDPAFDAYLLSHPAEPLDKLQALYEYYVGNLVAELPANYRVAILEFHDRSHAYSMTPELVYRFTTNKTLLAAMLRSINIRDHGATELLTEIVSAATYVASADFPYVPFGTPELSTYYLPFDNADVSAIVMVTDGRLTTPPGKVKEAADALKSLRVRLFVVGWGKDVNHEPLARIASESGGHYYTTKAAVQTDPDGNPIYGEDGEPIQLPTTAELGDYCFTEPSTCDVSIARDLQSQVVFSYVSLSEEPSVKTRIDAGFDDPNDDFGECGLPDQGAIFGGFAWTIDFDTFVGDVNLGQISMHTDGIQPDDTAQVIVRADYIPRNISEFDITLSSDLPFTVALANADEGGILWDWEPEPPAPVNTGGEFVTSILIASPDGTPLRYGEFGDLFVLDFAGIPGTFAVRMEVDNGIYVDTDWPYENKYFIYPDDIEVNPDGRRAPAFPTPLFTRLSPVHPDDLPNSFDLGASDNEFSFSIENIGGTYPYTFDPVVALNWAIGATPPFIADFSPSAGVIRPAPDSPVDVVTMTLNRDVDAGLQYGVVEVTYGHLYGSGSAAIEVYLIILPPVLDVPATFDCGDGTAPPFDPTNPLLLDVAITNTGQSTLYWEFNQNSLDALPAWITVSPTSDTAPYSDPVDRPISVNRLTADVGDFAYTLLIDGLDSSEEHVLTSTDELADNVPIEITGTILPPELTVSATTLDFGAVDTQRTLAITNTGNRILYWRVDTAGLPAWVSVTPSVGTLPYTSTTGATVNVSINRSMAPLAFPTTVPIQAYDGSETGPGLTGANIAINGTN
ncbi:MAG TPA: VWA domain-containing protein [Candidatus Hydrogenedentes bacterium]|nr:VWA domain-containing protein [Candidatus Hydrogenedentota bacterium]